MLIGSSPIGTRPVSAQIEGAVAAGGVASSVPSRAVALRAALRRLPALVLAVAGMKMLFVQESSMTAFASVVRSPSLFVVAGLCEIGGGWLMWKAIRGGRPAWWGLLGGLILVLYGIIPTLQASHFGRTYAAYGGFFIVLSLLWGWGLDGDRPDRADVIGSLIALVGVSVMMYWPGR